MTRAMGVDFGEKRIGLAVSDPHRTIAFPREVLQYSGKMSRGAALVAKQVALEEVGLVVVGLPLEMDGRRGPQADRVSSFIGLLRKALPEETQVREWDERLTSVQAGRVLDEAGVKQHRRRGKVDPIAAALLLQAYLDRESRREEGV